MPNIIFQTKDPLGNDIALLKETFEKHIIIRHPEMKNQVENIKQAIEKPLFIGLGTKSNGSMVYLRKLSNAPTPYLVVAVRKIKKLNKIILTAFGTKNLGLNKINKILWQGKKQTDFTTPILQRPKR